jgi:hypothetical protein
VVKYASHNSQGEAASEAVDCCLQALEDLELALQEPPSAGSAAVETMRSKIGYLVQALDSVLQIVPSALMPNQWTPALVPEEQVRKVERCTPPKRRKNNI